MAYSPSNMRHDFIIKNSVSTLNIAAR